MTGQAANMTGETQTDNLTGQKTHKDNPTQIP